MSQTKWKIVEASAGRWRAKQGWVVLLTMEKPGFGRTLRRQEQFQKFDQERFWEDELGWFVHPENDIAKYCDAAVAAFTPFKTEPEAKAVADEAGLESV